MTIPLTPHLPTALLASALLALAGCQAGPAAPATAGTNKPAMRALGETVAPAERPSDETIGAEVRRRLEITDAASATGVIVEVENGVVTLRGTVATVTAAMRAEAAARAVPGVSGVSNRLLTNER
jgi:osmotically-inducible protein OsmY